jgi:hypothetical protein
MSATSRFGNLSRAARKLLSSVDDDALNLGAKDLKADDEVVVPPIVPEDEEEKKDPPPVETEDEPAPAAIEEAPKSDELEPTADAKAAARVTAVFASEHSVGRERQAAKLLCNEKLTADDITGLLADFEPKAAAGDGMLKSLAEQPNPAIATGADGKPAAVAADDIWAKARAANAPAE